MVRMINDSTTKDESKGETIIENVKHFKKMIDINLITLCFLLALLIILTHASNSIKAKRADLLLKDGILCSTS